MSQDPKSTLGGAPPADPMAERSALQFPSGAGPVIAMTVVCLLLLGVAAVREEPVWMLVGFGVAVALGAFASGVLWERRRCGVDSHSRPLGGKLP